MKQRPFGARGTQVSALGLGTARLPDPRGAGDEEVIRLVRHAIDRGVSYLDLGTPYDRRRHTAMLEVLGRALAGDYRERVRLAARLPCFLIETAADVERYLELHLRQLQVRHIDFLILGGINRDTWPWLLKWNLLRRLEAIRDTGRIGGLGFGFHDQLEVLRGIIADYGNWDLCEFQYSFLDVDHHPGVSGLRFAADQGLAVVAVEPLRGDSLRHPPPEVAAIWASATVRRTPAEWGLRWLWNHPEIATVVCDPAGISELDECLALAAAVESGGLGVRDQLVVNQARDAYRRLRPVPCAACRACLPCPEDIDVARVFEIYNDGVMTGDMDAARRLYGFEQHRLEDCNECGVCAQRCGREIAIVDWLRKVREMLAEDRPV